MVSPQCVDITVHNQTGNETTSHAAFDKFNGILLHTRFSTYHNKEGHTVEKLKTGFNFAIGQIIAFDLPIHTEQNGLGNFHKVNCIIATNDLCL